MSYITSLKKKYSLLKSYGVNISSISRFQQVLNSALPTNSNEVAVRGFIRDVYMDDRKKYLNNIRHTKYECLVLWIDGSSIVDFLGIKDRVRITWNEGLYTVTNIRATMGTTGVDCKKYEHPLVTRFKLDKHILTPNDETEQDSQLPTSTIATSTIATSTIAAPTVATPTVAPPTVATPTVATPTVATPTVDELFTYS